MQEKNPEELAEQQVAELQQLKKDYVATFSTEAGKKVLAHLEGISFVHKTTFPKNSEALALAFHEGMRFVVVHIRNMMNFNIETLKKLIQKEE